MSLLAEVISAENRSDVDAFGNVSHNPDSLRRRLQKGLYGELL